MEEIGDEDPLREQIPPAPDPIGQSQSHRRCFLSRSPLAHALDHVAPYCEDRCTSEDARSLATESDRLATMMGLRVANDFVQQIDCEHLAIASSRDRSARFVPAIGIREDAMFDSIGCPDPTHRRSIGRMIIRHESKFATAGAQ